MDARRAVRLLAALDTNILVYAEGLGETRKQDQATRLIDELAPSSIVLPAQVLGELFNVLVRKGRRSPIDARRIVVTWQDIYLVPPTTRSVLTLAFDVAVDHQLATWDAVILAAAAEAGCRVLLSEDMQDGFTWGGVTIVNPFAPSPNRLLDDLMTGAR